MNRASTRPLHRAAGLGSSSGGAKASNGIVLKWTSLQLGHGSIAITERHYARWMTQDGYRNPWQVPEGCLPTDLFAELDGWIPGHATATPLGATKLAK